MDRVKAFISGINGQDGSYLAELLLKKGYEVFGVVRRGSTVNTSRLDHLLYPKEKIDIRYGDLEDTNSLYKLMLDIKPDEIYNIGSQSHVRVSFDIPESTGNITGLGVCRILETTKNLIKHDILKKDTKFYQASSCLPAGTKILTRINTKRTRKGKEQNCKMLRTKSIEKIKIGDLVLSYNEKTGKKEYKKVIKTSNRLAKDMFFIKFSNNNFLELSDNHPIFVVGKGWVQTDKLRVEDKIIQKRYPGLSGIIMKGKTNNQLYGPEKAKEVSKRLSIGQKNKTFIHPWKGKKLKEYNKKAYDILMKKCAWKQGNIPWNYGLTKETNSILKENGKKISPKLKEAWKTATYREKWFKASKKRPNKGEIMFQEFLEKYFPNEFNYVGNKSLWLGNPPQNPGFVHVTKNKVIEYNGTFWHFEDETIRDKRKQNYKKCGYDCLYVWDYEMKNLKDVNDKIQQFLFNPSVDIITIISIEKSKPKKVYNIEVEDNHNFFAKGILVHNSEMFGLSPPPQNELTPMLPVSPYGVAKLYGYHMVRTYRFGYKMFACQGILFNHESSRRGETFVTKKIVRDAVRIKLGQQDKIHLGNLEAKRDWGFAEDYMEAIFLIMHHTVPDDFVVATQEFFSVKDFAETVFKKLNLDINHHLVSDDIYRRPNEVPELRGDATKIRDTLGWKPKVKFNELIDMMLKSIMKEEKVKLNGERFGREIEGSRRKDKIYRGS